MAAARPALWFGFGFCGFGQAPGSGRGLQLLSPEPLRPRAAGADICDVRAGWSYTALLTRAGELELSGAAGGAAGGCRDAWASEPLLAVLRAPPGPGRGPELQLWAPGAALRGEPLWARPLAAEAGRPDAAGGGDDGRAGPLPLLPGARAHVSPRPPFCRALAPELRARRLELGAEHALLLDAAGQVFSWGAGRHGQLGHGTLEAVPAPRAVEALQGLAVAQVAAGDWHSACVSEAGDVYVWGWNESGQLALPARRLEEAGPEGAAGRDPPPAAADPDGGGAEAESRAGPEPGAPFIAVQPFPALLDLPLGADALEVACGSRHTAVVTRAGELYTWGWGKYGQLGLGDTASCDRPRRVDFFVRRRLRVRAVRCGPWNTYVRAVEPTAGADRAGPGPPPGGPQPAAPALGAG